MQDIIDLVRYEVEQHVFDSILGIKRLCFNSDAHKGPASLVSRPDFRCSWSRVQLLTHCKMVTVGDYNYNYKSNYCW